MSIQQAISALTAHKDLTASQTEAALEEIMSGSVQTPDIVAFLTSLKEKGETAEELAAAVTVMRRHAVKVHARTPHLLDTCGTGGDKKNTFNISTAAAFVVSGAGVTVAKHGNRAVSSKSGSADILQALGVNICAGIECVQRCLNEIGIAFLFAQQFHPAMKYAMPARKKIPGRTIFNFLGPLSNPAGATHQLVGVFDEHWAGMLAGAFARLDTVHAVVVHGRDGLDEVSTMDTTLALDVRGGSITSGEIDPADFGISRGSLEGLTGGSAEENARVLLELVKGRKGSYRDIVVLNAACALYAADVAGNEFREGIKNGIRLAERAIDSGKALEKLELLKEYTNRQ